MRKKDVITFYGTTLFTMLALVPISITNNIKSKETGKPLMIKEINKDNEYIENSTIREMVKELKDDKVKQEVLNNFSKCDTLEKIFKRQSELESLELTDEDKMYKDCPLSAEIQRFIFEQSESNNIPFDFLMSVIHVESRGNFNSSGQIGYNSNSHDLGLTQQNTISSLSNFMKVYNVSYEDGYMLLKDNDYVNVCAALLVCNEINKQFDEFDACEYAGCYNGWLNWRSYSVSREYVSMFQEVYNEIYTDYHTVTKDNNNSNNKKKIKQ